MTRLRRLAGDVGLGQVLCASLERAGSTVCRAHKDAAGLPHAPGFWR